MKPNVQRPRDASRQRPWSWRTCTRRWRPSAEARLWWVPGDVARAGQVGGDGPTLGGVWQQSAAAFAQSATTRGLINHLEVLFTKFTKSPRIFTQSPRTVWKQQLPGVSWVDKIPAREQRPMVLLCLSDGLEAVGSTSQRGFAGFPVGSMSQRSRGSSCRWTSSCSSCSTREPTC